MKRPARWMSALVAAGACAGGAAADTATIPINARVVGEPVWHDDGYDIRDARGRMQHIPMRMPFFRTVSIQTTVVVALDRTEAVLERLQARRANGNTDLMVAAATGDRKTVSRALAKAPNVNARNVQGSTALMGAAAGGFEEIVRLLIEKGARVDLRNNQGTSALMLAARSGREDVVRRLLASGADADLADTGNHTALMYAIGGGHRCVAKALVENGARADYQNRAGVSPMALAQSMDQKDIVTLLSRARPAPRRSS